MRSIMAEWASNGAWFDSQYGNRNGWGAGGYSRPLSSLFTAQAVTANNLTRAPSRAGGRKPGKKKEAGRKMAPA
jgi:hypothetical protein